MSAVQGAAPAEPEVTEEPQKKSRIPVFLQKERLAPFLTVVLSGQIIYAAFEAFKGSLMLPFQEMLGISQTEYGILMGYIGIAMFLYVPAGWINNRFKVRTIIFWSLAWRLVTYLILFTLLPSFQIMSIIALSWGALDAIVWPAVVNGVSILSADQDKEGKGLAMGLLESIRRGTEFLMNGAVILAMIIWSDYAIEILRVAAIAYSLLIIPMMIAVVRYVPDTKIATEEGKSNSAAAFNGLLRVLLLPRVWLAGIAALTVYWSYINLIYASAPFLQQVFNVPPGTAAVFGIFNTGIVGIFAGVISGLLADYVFHSSTKMLAIALAMVTVATAIVIVLPTTPAMMWPILIMLIVVSIAVFLGRSVILAPIAELNLPEGISGSAMSVGSFLAYASIFWAYTLNGALLDQHIDDPATGYDLVFLITAGVALVGGLAAGLLVILNRRAEKQTAASEAKISCEVDAAIAKSDSEAEERDSDD